MRIKQKLYPFLSNAPTEIDARILDPIIKETDYITAQELSDGKIVWWYTPKCYIISSK